MRLVFALYLAVATTAWAPEPAEPPLVQSKEPFVLDPRFCIGGGGEACRIQPTPC